MFILHAAFLRFSSSAPNRFKRILVAIGWTALSLLGASLTLAEGPAELRFGTVEPKTKLGVGYAVKLVDMNGDQRPDIVIVDQKRIVWLENPNWNEHVLAENQTKPDNVCLAAHDIDGDGRVDFALGADWRPFDTKTGGTLQWLRPGKTSSDKWDVFPIAEFPTLHRIDWADLDGSGKKQLVVVPLMGKNATAPEFADQPLEVTAWKIPADPAQDAWTKEVLASDVHVAHNFQVVDLRGDGKRQVLLASAEGVSLIEKKESGKWERRLLGEGNQSGKMPARGASEIKLGRLKGGVPFIATIEPWHGHQVVVYTEPSDANRNTGKWNRWVLDENLKWGHAVWSADLDGDGSDELVIGVRDNKDDKNPCGVRIYRAVDAAAGKWTSQRLDPGGVAVEDLLCGDLNADGKPEIIAVGRATHNVKVYWNENK